MEGRTSTGSAPDLTPERLQRALRGRFGRPHRLLEVTGSTNTDALAWAERGAPEGALVVAEHQTEGRGRWGRRWESRPGRTLLFSLVLRPQRPARDLGLLSTAVGVGVAEAIEECCGLRCGLKWPNDVTVAGRKLAGVLVETRLEGDVATVAVVGVGINVGWRREDMPADLAARATSIAAEGASVERASLLSAVLARLEDLCTRVTDPSSARALLERATARSDVVGRRVRVRSAGGRVAEGIATALSPTGALEVDGRALESGEIEEVRWV